MAKMVGFACNIKATWMKYAREMLSEGLSKEEYKKKLNEYLAFEIDSPVRLRKSREILMHIWFYDNDTIVPLRQQALVLINKYPDYEVAIGLCLIYVAYPVVADICNIIGRLLDFQEYFTNGMIKQKLYDDWGERGSLETTSRQVTLTLKDMGLLKAVDRTMYKPEVMKIKQEDVAAFLLYVAMLLDGGKYYPYISISKLNLLFSFRYSVSKECLYNDDRFILSNFAGQLSVAIS